MITADELTAKISATIGKLKVVELSRILRKQNFALHDLIDITFSADSHIAFRAAWILENVFLEHPEAYLTDLEYLLSRVKDVKIESCQRHYAKIVMHISSNKAPAAIKNKLLSINMEPVVERLFDWLINVKVKIAVKVFAAEALFNLRHRYTWIADELVNQLHFLMRNGSAAIQVRGKKILNGLKK